MVSIRHAIQDANTPRMPIRVIFEDDNCRVASFTFNAIPDTGASKTILSHDLILKHGIPVNTGHSVQLFACNNNEMKCNGMANVKLEFKNVATPVEAIVTSDIKDDILISCQDLIRMNVIPKTFMQLQHCRACKTSNDSELDHSLQSLIQDYNDVFEPAEQGLKPMKGPPMHIHLKKDAAIKPIKILTSRRTPIHLEEAAEKEINSLVDQGILKKVDHPTSWCSPAMFVVKPDGKSLRLVTDFRVLNKYVERPIHPFPSASDIVSAIPAGTKYFVKFDALKGYFQIPLDEESMDLTAFMVPGKGRYVYKRAPMGLCSSGDEYCARGDAAFQDIPGVKKIVDDILIFGEDLKTVTERTRLILTRCRENSITLSKKKVEFGQEVKFAGFLVSAKGVKPDPDKMKAIRDFPKPKTITDLRSFLGLANQLGQFVPDLAHASRDIRSLLKKDVSWIWLPEHEESFKLTKEVLLKNTILEHYDKNRPVELMTDASRLYGLGYALIQRNDEGHIRLIQCGSRALTDTETRYATIELELLAIVWAIRKCHFFLASRLFTVITDHKPLVGIFKKNINDSIDNQRIQRFIEKIAGYTFEVTWTPGKQMCIADALSRAPVFQPKEAEIISRVMTRSASDPQLTKIIEEAVNDKGYQKVVQAFTENIQPKNLSNEHPAKPYTAIWDILALDDSGLLLFGDRIVIPSGSRQKILDLLHLSHSGICKTRERAKQLYFWPGISNDIKNMIESCDQCQLVRPSLPKDKLVETKASSPMEALSADLFQAVGKQYLVMVDRYSGFPWVSELRRLDTNAVTSIMINWFQDWGLPRRIRTDGGPQFRLEFEQFCNSMGIIHELSSP